MAKNDVQITVTGDANDAIQEFQKIQNEYRKLDKAHDASAAIAKRKAAEERQLARESLAIVERNLTAEERRAKGIETARKALAASRVTFEEYQRELKRLNEAYMEESGLAAEARKKQAQEASEAAKREADAEKAKLDKVRAAEKQAAEEAKKHGEVAKKAFHDTETEVERLERQLDELHAAYKSGAVDQRSYERQQQRLNTQLVQTREKGKQTGGVLADLRAGFGKLTQSVGGSIGGLGSFAGKAGIATAAITALTKSLLAADRANKELLQKEGETLITVDEQVNAFMRQGDRNPADRQKITGQFLDIAEANKAQPELVAAAATAFESAGFAGTEANGLLDLYVKAAQSANATGVAPEDVIKPVSQFLEAQGREKTADNFAGVMMKGRGLFSSGAFEFSDLEHVAKIAPGLSASGATEEEILGMFASMRESLSPEVAATGLKNVVAKLKAAPGDKGRSEALQEIGIKASDVDIAGESAETALTRLSDALAKVDEQTRNVTLGKLFGLESTDAAIALMNSFQSGDVSKRIAMQNDQAGFVRGYQIAQSGPAAAEQEAKVKAIRTDLNREADAMQERLTRQAQERMNQRAMQRATEGGRISDMWFGADEQIRQFTRRQGEKLTGRVALPQGDIDEIRNEMAQAGLAMDESKLVDINSGASSMPIEERYREQMLDEQRKANKLLDRVANGLEKQIANPPVQGVIRQEEQARPQVIQRQPMKTSSGGAFGGGQ